MNDNSSVYNTSNGSSWTRVNLDSSSATWSSSYGLSAASLSNTLYIFGYSLTNPQYSSNNGIKWTSYVNQSIENDNGTTISLFTNGISASNNGVTMGNSIWMIGKQKVWKLN